MTFLIALAFALTAALGMLAGYWLAVHRLNRKVLAMSAATTANRLATQAEQLATVDRYRAEWRDAVRFGRGRVA